MIVLLIIAIWLAVGGLGAYLAYRGSLRDWERDIYGVPFYFFATIAGVSGFLGTMVAW